MSKRNILRIIGYINRKQITRAYIENKLKNGSVSDRVLLSIRVP